MQKDGILNISYIWQDSLHSPVELKRYDSTLTLQQAPHLPHGHLTCILSRVQVDRRVIHWRLRWNQDRGGGGGGGRGRVRERRRGWGPRRRKRTIGGGRSEGWRWGRDESGERWLWRKAVTLWWTPPIRSGDLVVGDRAMRLGVGWRRWMGDGYWFNDVCSVALTVWEKSMQRHTKTN